MFPLLLSPLTVGWAVSVLTRWAVHQCPPFVMFKCQDVGLPMFFQSTPWCCSISFPVPLFSFLSPWFLGELSLPGCPIVSCVHTISPFFPSLISENCHGVQCAAGWCCVTGRWRCGSGMRYPGWFDNISSPVPWSSYWALLWASKSRNLGKDPYSVDEQREKKKQTTIMVTENSLLSVPSKAHGKFWIHE